MTIDLDTLILARGAHKDRDDGLCLLEAVAWFAGRSHSDQPPCVSPALGAYGRTLNDVLPDIPRQELKQSIPQLPGPAGRGQKQPRTLTPRPRADPPPTPTGRSPSPLRPPAVD